MRVLVSAAVAGLATIAAACGSSATSTVTVTVPAATSSPATPSATSIAAPTPGTTAVPETAIVAVAQRIFPAATGGGFGECDSGNDASACPITDRLRGRLAQHPTSGPGGGAAPLCRCQNSSDTRDIVPSATAGGGVAHVSLFSGQVKIDLVIVIQGGQLLVDDTQCTGKPGTSIYTVPVGPCA